MTGDGKLRVFVCGGRHFRDVELVSRILTAIEERTGITRIIEGGDRAGLFAAEWAVARSIEVLTVRGHHHGRHDIAWKVEQILSEGPPELAIGFSGGATTALLLGQLERAGVRVRAVDN